MKGNLFLCRSVESLFSKWNKILIARCSVSESSVTGFKILNGFSRPFFCVRLNILYLFPNFDCTYWHTYALEKWQLCQIFKIILLFRTVCFYYVRIDYKNEVIVTISTIISLSPRSFATSLSCFVLNNHYICVINLTLLTVSSKL